WIVGLDILPVVRNLLGADDGQYHRLMVLRAASRATDIRVGTRSGCPGISGPHIQERQIQGKCATTAGYAAQANLTAQQVRELAADRKTQSGAPVLSRRTRVGLLERLEDDLLLLERDPDTRVADREFDHRGSLAQDRMVRAPTPCRDPHVQAYATVIGELQSVRQQVLQHLQ